MGNDFYKISDEDHLEGDKSSIWYSDGKESWGWFLREKKLYRVEDGISSVMIPEVDELYFFVDIVRKGEIGIGGFIRKKLIKIDFYFKNHSYLFSCY